jgi:polysaccharide export outer membrane protein
MNIKLLWIALVAAVAMGCAKTPENRSSFAGNEEAAYSATADASQAVADVSAAPIPQQVTSQRVATSTPASQQEAAYQYVIGPGDTLDVFVWGYKDLSVTIPVRPDGKITTRLVEDMVASGKTPTQLARELESKYEVYVKNPTVTVTVNKFIGVPSQQVKVVGGGAKPRTVPYVNGMTVLDVMIEVGGLKKFSSGNKAVLVRTVNGERKSYRVRLHDLLKKGVIKANGYVQPGDIIIIPESWF